MQTASLTPPDDKLHIDALEHCQRYFESLHCDMQRYEAAKTHNNRNVARRIMEERPLALETKTLIEIELYIGGPAGWLELVWNSQEREIERGDFCYQNWFSPVERIALNRNDIDLVQSAYLCGDPSILF